MVSLLVVIQDDSSIQLEEATERHCCCDWIAQISKTRRNGFWDGMLELSGNPAGRIRCLL